METIFPKTFLQNSFLDYFSCNIPKLLQMQQPVNYNYWERERRPVSHCYQISQTCQLSLSCLYIISSPIAICILPPTGQLLFGWNCSLLNWT